MDNNVEPCPRCDSENVTLKLTEKRGPITPARYTCDDCGRMGPAYYKGYVELKMIAEGWNRLTPSEQLIEAKELISQMDKLYGAYLADQELFESIAKFTKNYPVGEKDDRPA